MVATDVKTRARHKPYRGLPMEGPIARWYAKNTSGSRDYRETAVSLAATLAPGSAVLEVAPGPGYLAIELARLGSFSITGLDISRTFVEIARENARQAGVAVDFRQGNASQMPLPEETFDLVICRAAFKNFTDPVGALDEIHRVLKPGGRASIIDLRKDAPLDAIEREVEGMRLSPVNAWLTRLTFRTVLLKNAYTQEALEGLVAESRFGSGQVLEDGIGFDLRLVRSV